MKNIPVLHVEGDSIAKTWEDSLIALYEKGCRIPTQYDKKDDENSRDCTMILTVNEPLKEPMIHKSFPAGVIELEEYCMEVCEGIKDHLINKKILDPKKTKWEYTYHQRLFNYGTPWSIKDGCHYNQIEYICQSLKEAPFTRRAQAVVWRVLEDNARYDSPCLQSIWCRILEDEGESYLNMNVRIRSNDAYRAAFMNIFAFVRLQMEIANRISHLTGKNIKIGRYCHMADSYHIYGSTFEDFEKRFLKAYNTRTFEDRTIRYEDVCEEMNEARPKIREKNKKPEIVEDEDVSY